MLGALLVSLDQLRGYQEVLEEFSQFLKKHDPSDSKNLEKCLKSLVWSLKNGKRGNVLKRLERYKSTLELALLGISM
jgi:hypothetical protein